MDSADITANLACTPNGVVVTVTITRSANYVGTVAQNVSWRPRIELIATLLKPNAVLETIWRMRLTTGNEVNRGEQLRIIDFEGGQTGDLVAFSADGRHRQAVRMT
jgi:uncharacterized protein YcgI (DUF1989 family)